MNETLEIKGMQGFIPLDNLATYQVTLLDYFAVRAMQSYLTRTDSDMIDNDDIANASYDMASAMVCAKQDLEDLQERLKTIDTAIKVDINDL